MGVEPPFIYDRPSSYTFAGPTSKSFNPRAATQASWTPRPEKPKQDGPLINFNKHPDTYVVVPYGNLNAQPMNPKTKDRVTRARRLQLTLRILALIGALGLLFCVIAINQTTASVGWIIRIAPAVAICHTVYGISHLCRSATGRTPTSTASYMIFAAILDTGLIPFFVFSALMANADFYHNTYGWSTLFKDDKISYTIIFAFYIASTVEAGLMLISLIMDIYLGVMFRKIARLPPDMNPLEPNLTNRGHKRNKSEITQKQMSNSALASRPDSGVAGTRRVPFMHTRTDSADSVTLYGNNSARNSRVEFRKELDDCGKDPYRASYASSQNTLSPSRPSSAINPSPTSRTAGAGLEHRPNRSSGLAQETSRPSSWLSYMDYEGIPSTLSDTASEQLDHEVRPMSPVSPISSGDPSLDHAQAERENWYQTPTRNSEPNLPFYTGPNSSPSYNRTLAVTPDHNQGRKRSREPLGMNPPTPLKENFQDQTYQMQSNFHGSTPFDSDLNTRPVLRDTTANIPGRRTPPSRPSSFIGSGSKTKFYGDLRTSMGADSRKTYTTQADEFEDQTRTKTMESTSDYSGNIQIYDSAGEEEIDNHDRMQPSVYTQFSQPVQWNGARQTSNSTGYDLHSGYAGLGPEFGKGMGRRRDVSGKVVEEGRSPVYQAAAQTPPRGGAAGWARFKGL